MKLPAGVPLGEFLSFLSFPDLRSVDTARLVTESARACSYHSVITGMQTARLPAVPFLIPPCQKVSYTHSVVSKSVFYTL